MLDDSPKTVLVIDDDLDLLDLVTFILEAEGYNVQTAADGREGMQKLEQQMPNLILLDMQMPVMNGWEFARQFHSRYDSQVPVVVITAAASARMAAEEIGAQAWISKPFDLDKLVSTVDHFASMATPMLPDQPL